MPTLKVRASAAETSKPTGEAAREGKKRKERVKKTTIRVLGRSSIMREPEEDEEEEDAALAPKSQKLMGDAINSGVAAMPKSAPKAVAPVPKTAPKRSTRNIPSEEENKAQCLRLKKRKLKPKC